MNKSMLKALRHDLDFIQLQKGRYGRLGKLIGIVSPSFVCTSIYRLAHACHTSRTPMVSTILKVISKLLWWLNMLLFSSDIDPRANLSAALYLPHPLGIVIGNEVVLSGTAKVMQGVTLGGNVGQSTTREGQQYHQPHVNGAVFVGANSLVVGPICLSGKLFIGALQVITRSIDGSGVVTKHGLAELTVAHRKELGMVD